MLTYLYATHLSLLTDDDRNYLNTRLYLSRPPIHEYGCPECYFESHYCSECEYSRWITIHGPYVVSGKDRYEFLVRPIGVYYDPNYQIVVLCLDGSVRTAYFKKYLENYPLDLFWLTPSESSGVIAYHYYD